MGEALTDVQRRHMVADLTVGLRLRVHMGEAAQCRHMAEAELRPTGEVEGERHHTGAAVVTPADSVEAAAMPRLAEVAGATAAVVTVAEAGTKSKYEKQRRLRAAFFFSGRKG